jgi:hypothetical protein
LSNLPTDDHASSAVLDEAAAWLSANWNSVKRPLLPAIRKRFDVDSVGSIEIIRQARKMTEAGNDVAS